MSKTIVKEYKNVKIHSTLRGADPQMDGIKTFCDSTPAKFEKFQMKRTIEFKDLSSETFMNHISIGQLNTARTSNFGDIDMSFEDTLEVFNNFNLDEYSLNFRNYKTTTKYGLNFKLIDEVTENNLTSGKIEITFDYYKCLNCNTCITSYFYMAPKTSLLGAYIFNDEDQIKLTTMYKQIAVNDKFGWHRYYKNMIIYKKETGKIYKVENFNTAGSKYLMNKNKKIIKDITFASSEILNIAPSCNMTLRDDMTEAYMQFVDAVNNDLEERTGSLYNYTKSDLKYLSSLNDIEMVDWIGAIPTVSNSELVYSLQIKRKYNIQNTLLSKLIQSARTNRDNIHSIIKNMSEKEMMSHFKVNTKRLQKIHENYGFNSYVEYYDLIEDQNNLNKLIELSSRGYKLARSSAKYKDFLYQYKKNNTEKRFMNQLSANINKYYLSDTIDLFRMIKEKMKDYSVDYSKTIEELHDIFSKDYNKLQHENKKIAINKTISSIFKDFSVNGITYRMPKDTDELIKVGAFMDICVGGYGERAVNKDCYIVIGYNKDNKPVTCLEFKKYKNEYNLVQAKKRKNYTPKDSETNALSELLEKNKVSVETIDLKENRFRKLNEEDSEILGERKNFTYAVQVPDELRQELLEVI